MSKIKISTGRRIFFFFLISIFLDADGYLEAQDFHSQDDETLSIEGRLVHETIEGGFWTLRAFGNLYDLHGFEAVQNAPHLVKEGDCLKVTGKVLKRAACFHMRGIIFQVERIERSQKCTAQVGWQVFARSIICYDDQGNMIKVVPDSDLLPGTYPLNGGHTEAGNYGWIITKDAVFQFYDRQGRLLWQKGGVQSAVVSQLSSVAILSMRKNSDYYANIFDKNGQTIMSIDDPLQSARVVYFSMGGRFGYAKVRNNKGVVFFDALKRKMDFRTEDGSPHITDEGDFMIYRKDKATGTSYELWRGKFE